MEQWKGFSNGEWNQEVNVRDFILKNFTPYTGDESFLEGPTNATTKLWNQVMELSEKEREAGGVLDADTKIVSTITSHGPGYLDKEIEPPESLHVTLVLLLVYLMLMDVAV